MARSFRVASIVLAGVAALGFDTALAQSKIAVVDLQRLEAESPQGKAIRQSYENAFGPRRRELETMRKDLEGRNEKLQRDGAVMAENERRAAEKELQSRANTFEMKAKEFKQDEDRWRREEITKLDRALRERIDEFARSAGYELVLPVQVVLYRNDAVDITAQVLGALSSSSAKPPAAKPSGTPSP
jgi:outer membrane protein